MSPGAKRELGALSPAQDARLVQLARNERTLSEKELEELWILATVALYAPDDYDLQYNGERLVDLSAEQQARLGGLQALQEREDLSVEQRAWLQGLLYRMIPGEHRRRSRVRGELRRRIEARPARGRVEGDQTRRETRARPRERSAPRRRRTTVGSRDRPRPSADDDPDPVDRREATA